LRVIMVALSRQTVSPHDISVLSKLRPPDLRAE
jgi:hypothetical protein